MKNIWMRAGIQLLMNDDEVEVILGANREEANIAVSKIISEGRFRFDGESYIPQVCIEQFNAQNGTKYNDRDDIEFDIESGTFMKYRILKETDWYKACDVIELYDAKSGREIDTTEFLSDDVFDDCEVAEFTMKNGWLSVTILPPVNTKTKPNGGVL